MNMLYVFQKIIKIILMIMILLLIFRESVFSQENKGKTLISKQLYKIDSIIVIEDSTLIDGYLIFKIHKNPDTSVYKIEKKFYTCDIFWIKYLNYIKNDTSYYFYNFYNLLYNQYIINNDYQKNNSLEYLKFKNIFEKYFQSYNDAAYYMMQVLNTNIFNNVKFWNFSFNYKVGYFIYKISLKGTLLSALISTYKKDSESKLTKNKIFLPLSNSFILSEPPIFELYDQGFRESKWYPKNLYGE